MTVTADRRDLILLEAGEGRRYEMGGMTAVFKADEVETGCGYSVSEWLLAPGFEGGGAHSHTANDEIFYVVEGKPDILIDRIWQTVLPGTFVRIPGGVDHDFRNRSRAPAKLLNLFIPGGFEREMPAIVSWFQTQAGP
ncbi:cupin domain-containing protein [Brevundimonas staleyi]|uniref:Cupin domain-containing protein n=1 Tax=Brevundimonas staleyi TaxID=74326 RepID=A0ABW0FVG6_9CAUL